MKQVLIICLIAIIVITFQVDINSYKVELARAHRTTIRVRAALEADINRYKVELARVHQETIRTRAALELALSDMRYKLVKAHRTTIRVRAGAAALEHVISDMCDERDRQANLMVLERENSNGMYYSNQESKEQNKDQPAAKQRQTSKGFRLEAHEGRQG